MQSEFEELDVKLAIISTNDLDSHSQWKLLMEIILRENGSSEKIEFPLIEYDGAWISNKCGMLHAGENPTRDVRGVFIINLSNEIKSINFYPITIGRNKEEIKRIIFAFQTSEQDQVLIPANWEVGDDVLMKYVPYSESELADVKSPASISIGILESNLSFA